MQCTNIKYSSSSSSFPLGECGGRVFHLGVRKDVSTSTFDSIDFPFFSISPAVKLTSTPFSYTALLLSSVWMPSTGLSRNKLYVSNGSTACSSARIDAKLKLQIIQIMLFLLTKHKIFAQIFCGRWHYRSKKKWSTNLCILVPIYF